MKISIVTSGSWLIAYLFVVGFAKLSGWTLLWAFLFWPFYLGDSLRLLAGH